MRKIMTVGLFLSSLCSIVPTFTSADAKSVANLEIGTQGDALKFDHDKLSVTANQKIRLTFKNNATKGSKMQHSWILTRPDTEAKVVASASSAGSEKKYIPETPDILAHTKLLDPGESQTITFQAPSKPGNYPYICTFPGHSYSMKGSLEVK